MARTFTFGDAMSLVQPQISRQIQDNAVAYICNVAIDRMWRAFDWRESIGALPPFYLQPFQQDHGAPAVCIPADFTGLRKAFWVRLSSLPCQREPLRIVQELELTHVRYLPHSISYEKSVNCFRLFPRVPDAMSAPTYLIDGTYKKRPTKVTAANLVSTFLPFDDQYLDVMVEALKWSAWTLSGDQRAGQITVQQGITVYTGQAAVMRDAIREMASNECLELGDPIIAPSEPLVIPNGYYRPTLLGWGM